MDKGIEKNMRCGMVSIVGRPNVGKSTLLNKIIGEKIAIVSRVPQTTRYQIRGIYNDKRGQIVFIDTPGFHVGKDKLDKLMYKSSTDTMDGADCIIHLVDTNRHIGPEERSIVEKLKAVNVPVILGLNKVDLKATYASDYIALWESAKDKKVQDLDNFTLIALSGKNETNLDKLIDVVFGYLPQSPALYPEDILSDVPQRMTIADIIREKLFRTMKDEIPHSLGVVVEHMQPKKGKTWMIKALILVERDTQKEIVIGKKGDVLKKIGTQARKDLEELLEAKVFLELHVRVEKRWRDDFSLLQEFGYVDQQ